LRAFFALIAEVGPARATVITYVNPAVAVGLGALVLNERITLVMLGAFVLILGGSVLATRGGRAESSGADVQTAADESDESADGSREAVRSGR